MYTRTIKMFGLSRQFPQRRMGGRRSKFRPSQRLIGGTLTPELAEDLIQSMMKNDPTPEEDDALDERIEDIKVLSELPKAEQKKAQKELEKDLLNHPAPKLTPTQTAEHVKEIVKKATKGDKSEATKKVVKALVKAVPELTQEEKDALIAVPWSTDELPPLPEDPELPTLPQEPKAPRKKAPARRKAPKVPPIPAKPRRAKCPATDNKWFNHVRDFRQHNPELSYKQALQQASATYVERNPPRVRRR
jgi:hypothetical protein